MKNLLVWTKFYWSWAGGPWLIVRTANYSQSVSRLYGISGLILLLIVSSHL